MGTLNGAALDRWITGNYGEDHPDNGPLAKCPDCGELYDPNAIESWDTRPTRDPRGPHGCRCECEDTGEFRRYCECAACESWRVEMCDV